MKKKIVLAYSGGLDTTVIIPWLKENYDCDIVAVCVDVGQEADWASVKQRIRCPLPMCVAASTRMANEGVMNRSVPIYCESCSTVRESSRVWR